MQWKPKVPLYPYFLFNCVIVHQLLGFIRFPSIQSSGNILHFPTSPTAICTPRHIMNML